MHILATASDLVQGMTIVSRALSARPAKQIFEGVLLETIDEGVNLTCTDGEMTIRTRVNATVSRDGCCVLPAKLFGELMRKLPDGEVDIDVSERMTATIRYNGSRTMLTGMPAADFPDVRAITGGNTVSLPQKALRDAINRVIFAVATDESRKILTGSLIEIYRNETRLIGLDGFRLALQRIEREQNIPGDEEYLEAILPGKVAGEIGKLLTDNDEDAILTFNKSYLVLSFGATRLYTLLLAGEYINYKQILPGEWQTRIRVRRALFADAVERASLMAREGKNNLLRLHMEDNGLTITANAERGDVFEELPIDMDGKPLDIAFNARYLADVIRNIDDEEICLRFNSNVSPCVVCPPEGEQYLYLVLPVRVFS